MCPLQTDAAVALVESPPRLDFLRLGGDVTDEAIIALSGGTHSRTLTGHIRFESDDDKHRFEFTDSGLLHYVRSMIGSRLRRLDLVCRAVSINSNCGFYV